MKLLVACGAWLAVALPQQAATLTGDFSANPFAQGWHVFGDTNLFHWNTTNQNLEITWDSSRTNTYFYHPLGTVLTRNDDFSLAFNLLLSEMSPGANSNKPGAFQIAIGLLNLTHATRTNFFRGTGVNSPNLVEFDYFPDAGFGATIWPIFVSTNSVFNYNGSDDYTLIELAVGDSFHAEMTYTVSNQTLVTVMTRNGAPFGPIHEVKLSPSFTDFRVDAFSISSYSDAGQAYDSVLAHGTIDNIVVTTPPPPVQNLAGHFTNDVWQAQFLSRSHWLYTLERTEDLKSWAAVSPATSGSGATLTLQDASPPAPNAFYRVNAQRP